jgi:hypothetical protein
MIWLARFFYCVLVCSCCQCLYGQENYLYKDSALMAEETITEIVAAPVEDDEVAAVTEVQDSTLYANRLRLSADSVHKLMQQQKLKPVEGLSAQLQRLKATKRNDDKQTNSAPGWLASVLTSTITSAILWGVAIFIVLFVIARLFLSRGIFTTAGKKPTIVVDVPTEQAPTSFVDYARIIAAAKLRKDYAAATRLLYLQTLLVLKEKELIQFTADKTNRQYLAELSKTVFQPAFGQLTRQYEYICYGNFPVSLQQFDILEQQFQLFHKTVGQK